MKLFFSILSLAVGLSAAVTYGAEEELVVVQADLWLNRCQSGRNEAGEVVARHCDFTPSVLQQVPIVLRSTPNPAFIYGTASLPIEYNGTHFDGLIAVTKFFNNPPQRRYLVQLFVGSYPIDGTPPQMNEHLGSAFVADISQLNHLSVTGSLVQNTVADQHIEMVPWMYVSPVPAE